MKLTKTKLKQLIKEELQVLNEQRSPSNKAIHEVGDPQQGWLNQITGGYLSGGDGAFKSARWKHVGKKNALTKTVDKFMREMAFGSDVGTLWDKQGGLRPKLYSHVVDGIPVVRIQSPHLKASINLPHPSMSPVVRNLEIMSKSNGKWVRYHRAMPWEEATGKMYSHLLGTKGLRRGRGTGTKTVHGHSKTQKEFVNLDKAGRRTEKELERLKKKLNRVKNTPGAKQAQKEVEILEKALKSGKKKVGKLRRIARKLPIIGRFVIAGLFFFAAKEAAAAEGATGVAKVTAETAVDMTPIIGDIKGIFELIDMAGDPKYDANDPLASGMGDLM